MFTPVEAVVGATLIQVATTSYAYLMGRTIGFSSLLYDLVTKPTTRSVSLVGGLAAAVAVVRLWLPSFWPVYSQVGLPFYGAAGALVGWGTCWGSGCTSGHMLAGLSRLRWRSFVATCTFSFTAVIISTLLNLAPECPNAPCYIPDFSNVGDNIWKLVSLVVGSYTVSYLVLPQLKPSATARVLAGLNSGFLFGMGLFLSGMASPAKPLGFLAFLTPRKFDPSLAAIIIFAIIPNIFVWRRILPQTPTSPQSEHPLFEDRWNLPWSDATPPRFIVGNAIFGLGWGLMGVCPGPGLLGVLTNGWAGATWVLAFEASYFLAKQV